MFSSEILTYGVNTIFSQTTSFQFTAMNFTIGKDETLTLNNNAQIPLLVSTAKNNF